jgi:hypothetical protein
MKDYAELVVQYGFVTLFVVAYPLVPALGKRMDLGSRFVHNIALPPLDSYVPYLFVHRFTSPHALAHFFSLFQLCSTTFSSRT